MLNKYSKHHLRPHNISNTLISKLSPVAAVLGMKDPYTRKHGRRVAIYARRLAQRTGLEAADVEDRDVEFLYTDGEYWHFMEPSTFEQHAADSVAVGDAARLFSPERHDEIWAIQRPLNFPLTVYGYDREEASMQKITGRLAEALASHGDDSVLS